MKKTTNRWSYGIVLYELFNEDGFIEFPSILGSDRPVKIQNLLKQLYFGGKKLPDNEVLPFRCSISEIATLMWGCLEVAPEKRLSWKEIINQLQSLKQSRMPTQHQPLKKERRFKGVQETQKKSQSFSLNHKKLSISDGFGTPKTLGADLNESVPKNSETPLFRSTQNLAEEQNESLTLLSWLPIYCPNLGNKKIRFKHQCNSCLFIEKRRTFVFDWSYSTKSISFDT